MSSHFVPKMMSFHITFKDGSNPYFHFPCSLKEHQKALNKWKKNFDLTLIETKHDIEFYEAEEKEHGN